jgi:hypothetical protein
MAEDLVYVYEFVDVTSRGGDVAGKEGIFYVKELFSDSLREFNSSWCDTMLFLHSSNSAVQVSDTTMLP